MEEARTARQIEVVTWGGRRASYWLLNDRISHANYVMSRIEIKGGWVILRLR